MANKRGKVELKVYKPPGLDKEVAADPSWFTRRFIIDGIECGGIFCDSETKKDFTLRGCTEPFDFYRFSKTDYESGTCFVVGYPAGILIAEVDFYHLYTKDGYPLYREIRYLWRHPDKYATGCWIAYIGVNLRKHRECTESEWRRFKKWYNQQLRIHITQPWYQMAVWFWGSPLRKCESLYFVDDTTRKIKVYGRVYYAFEVLDREAYVTLPSGPPIPWRPIWC